MIRNSSAAASMTLDIISHSLTQTQRLGMRLGDLLRGGELILLDGQLGTGKTTLTQGIAQGMGITEVINSPTFTLLKEYYSSSASPPVPEQVRRTLTSDQPQHGLALYHFDLYRLDDPEEMIDLGFEDYFYGSGVSVVEWAEKASLLWPPEHLNIRLKVLSETKRSLLFIATGAHYCELVRQFQKNTYATTGS